MNYVAPLKDMRFVMSELADLAGLAGLPGCGDASDETVGAVLEENARFVDSVVAPLNRTGDLEPATLRDGKVTTTRGFKAAFDAYAAGGWQGLQHPVDFGGQGLPLLVAAPCIEMMQSANLAFALCPLLTDAAIEALMTAGSAAQKALYIPKLIDGGCTGTMNLTEPQAGSDLALVRTRALRQHDGSYRLTGQKIFITYGEHDLAPNILHMVLARTADAPDGVRGLSLFLVPKYLLQDGAGHAPGSGSVAAVAPRNDVFCTALEHKLGIRASPTAVLVFGDDNGEVGRGAIGYLVGEENRGLEIMFVMMNAARFAVGLQGIGLAQRAYQVAAAYARDRVQGRAVEGSSGPVAIVNHPDVRRLLMSMRAQIEAARAVAYVAAAASDVARHHPDPALRARARADYEYLVPIVKGWSTEMSIEVASAAVQVHGGMGFIEETGVAQLYRDARILTIYEGTTAIQANDLVGRKTARDGGAVARAFIDRMTLTGRAAASCADPDLRALAPRLLTAIAAYGAVVDFVVDGYRTEPRAVYAGAVPYLMLAGLVHGGWQMTRAALAARTALDEGSGDGAFLHAKIATARFFADHFLVRAPALQASIVDGAAATLALGADDF